MLRKFAIPSLALAFAVAAYAQDSQPPSAEPANLTEAVRQAQQNYRPVAPQEVAAAHRELAIAVRDVEGWLNRSGAARAAGWKKYLGWSDLENVVAQEGAPDAGVVRTLVRKLSANENGLENRRMVRMRRALEQYANLAATAADPKRLETYYESLDLLA